MSYTYRCGQCRTTTEPLPTRAAAERERERHRDRAHDGLIPDNEAITETPEDGVETAGLLAVLVVVLLIAAALTRLIY